MAEFASGAFLLVVKVQVRIGQLENISTAAIAADDVDHAADAARRNIAQRHAGDSANMVFELAGLGALHCPVPGVVDTRCHFVGNKPVSCFK